MSDQASAQEYVIDTETLIKTVKKHDNLWDYTHGRYKDRSDRRQSWIQVARQLVPDFETKDDSEQAFIAKQVEMKWRHMRDNYTREVRMAFTLDTARARRKKHIRYIYADLMDFLRPNIERKFNANPESVNKRVKTNAVWMKEEEEGESADVNFEPLQYDEEEEEEYTPTAPKRKAADLSERGMTFAEARNETLSDDSDDMAFFRSLAPMLSELSTKKKMLFRIDVMQTLVKYSGGDSND